MKGIQRSAIAIIPLAAVSSILWTPLKAVSGNPTALIAQAQSTTPAPVTGLNTGTQIPVLLPGGNPDDNLVMTVGESVDTSLVVAADILDAQNNVIIPQGSVITGTFAPEVINNRQGTRFKANQVIINNQPSPLQATSAPFIAKRSNQLTVRDVQSGISTIAAATVVDSAFNRVGRTAGIDRRIIQGAKRQTGTGVLPSVLKTGQQLTQKATSPSDVIVVNPNELGLALDTSFQNTTVANPPTTSAVSTGPLTVARGTRVTLRATPPGTRYIVDASESFPVRLRVAEDIYNSQNTLVIPKGSRIIGSITPSPSGSIFKASKLVTGNRSYALEAQTSAIAPTEARSLQSSALSGRTVTSPQASTTISESQSSNGGLLGQILGTSRRTDGRVIIFDPAATQLEILSDLALES